MTRRPDGGISDPLTVAVRQADLKENLEATEGLTPLCTWVT
jgi:hypothetical protein